MIIDKMIRSKNHPTREQLREACEEALYGLDGGRVSISTIDKDIAAMKNENEMMAPIAISKIYNGYYYTDPNYSLNIPLTETDVDALIVATSILKQFKGSDILKNLETAIDRINKKMYLKLKNNNDIIQFEQAPSFEGTGYLPIILEAIKDQQTLQIKYKRFQDKEELPHTIDPYLLKEYHNSWYVIGFNHEKNKILTFGLDRIISLINTHKLFKRLLDFDPQTIYKHSYGITFNNEKSVEIILSFTPLQGKYIKSKPLHETQKVITDNNKEYRISIQVIISQELINQILSYGNTCKIISPPKLQQKIKTTLDLALKQYKK